MEEESESYGWKVGIRGSDWRLPRRGECPSGVREQLLRDEADRIPGSRLTGDRLHHTGCPHRGEERAVVRGQPIWGRQRPHEAEGRGVQGVRRREHWWP